MVLLFLKTGCNLVRIQLPECTTSKKKLLIKSYNTVQVMKQVTELIQQRYL